MRWRATLATGAAIAARYLLRLGVALLGVRLTLGEVVTTGLGSVAAIVITVSTSLLLAAWLARRLGLVPPLSALVAVGMAICGNSAILALAPILRAPGRETAYAVSTITVFGLLGVITLPPLGHLLGLGDATFGTWAGLAVNDTAQVVATGFAFSVPAGDVATIVKLTRNVAILPVLLGATWWAARRDVEAPDAQAASPLRLLTRAVPWFVVGFVLLAALASTGVLDATLPNGDTLVEVGSLLAGLCILVALAGVGLSTDLRTLATVGRRPFLMGAVLWVVIGLLALGLSIVVTR